MRAFSERLTSAESCISISNISALTSKEAYLHKKVQELAL